MTTWIGGSAAARVLMATAAALVVSGCATKRDVRDLNSAITDLALREDSLIAQLRAEAVLTRDTLRGQTNQIVDFRGQISHQLLDIAQRLSQLEAIAGQNQRDMAAVRDQLANMRRPGQRAGGAAAADSGAVAPGVGGAPQAAGGTTTAGADAMYNTAVQKYHQGLLSTAQTAFRLFLDSYPNSALAPEVHFDLGDILEQQGDTTKALAEFRLIPSNFPAAPKAADAMYRIALIEIARKHTREAKATLQRIVNTYPGTGAAGLAKAKLDSIH